MKQITLGRGLSSIEKIEGQVNIRQVMGTSKYTRSLSKTRQKCPTKTHLQRPHSLFNNIMTALGGSVRANQVYREDRTSRLLPITGSFSVTNLKIYHHAFQFTLIHSSY